MGVNYNALVEDFKGLGVKKGNAFLRENFEKRELRPEHFDLGKLWSECFGYGSYLDCRKDYRDGGTPATKVLIEDAHAVTTAAFTSITGQIVYSAIIEKYNDPAFVFTQRIPTFDSKFLDAEKIAGITRLGDAALVRHEAQPYTLAGVGQNYIHAPSTLDRGFIVPVTREAIFADRTGELLRMAGETGYSMGLNIEKRAIDCVIDLNATATSALVGGHRYHWMDNSIATYGDSSGTHTWDNLSAGTTLTDWTSVEKPELLFAQMLDPFTNEPIMIEPEDIVVTPNLLHTAKQILRATENRLQVGGFATTGNLVTRVGPNTIKSYNILSSPMLYARQVTAGSGLATTWYIGNVAKAFKRKVNWPLATEQAPPMNEDEFNRQIVVKYRANERSAFTTVEPRGMAKCTVA